MSHLNKWYEVFYCPLCKETSPKNGPLCCEKSTILRYMNEDYEILLTPSEYYALESKLEVHDET